MGAAMDAMTENTIEVLDHGFVRLDDAMADDLSVVNGARVSFARRKTEMDEADEGLIRFLMRDRHGSPFEHNAFRFHVRCPIFVAREWMRHRVGCLTGDTVVTFVDTNGHASKTSSKTIDELWRMWTEGERNGHAIPLQTRTEIDRLLAEGRSHRAIARTLGVGRRAIRSHVEGRKGMRDARWRLRRMRLRVLNEETGEFTVGHVADVIDKGIQPVYRMTLADGKVLTLTENHRLYTSDGWLRMRDAVGLVGTGEEARMTRACELMTNGQLAHRDRGWLEAKRREGKSVAQIASEAGCSYHTVRKWLAIHDLKFSAKERGGRTPWNKGKRAEYRTGMVVSESHRAAIRAARSGERSNFWRGGVTSDRASIGAWATAPAAKVHSQYDYVCQECSERGGKLHAHHIVPVWCDPSKARDIGNLITVCENCHRAIHRTRDAEFRFADRHANRIGFARDIAAPIRTGFALTAHPVRVVSIAYVGLRQTYDLSVEGPWHNFVANGVVVHNSFNEFSLRYAKATDDFYVPEADDVRTQVGKPGAYTFEPVSDELAQQTRDELQAVYDHAYETYERLVESGVAREVARSVLPVGAYTQFYWTVNARSLMNFVSLRNSQFAQLEIRRYAEAVEAFFAARMPVTHAAFLANDRVAP
ncbi:MAG: FAD-dependent thymidylate synthase [Actinobacteria bacterium]|nr:FAD-dependent thymidylate synthase [Actinomycetota bacterium]